jgi:poly(ADP-ribose) glycohydrolase ARH3
VAPSRRHTSYSGAKWAASASRVAKPSSPCSAVEALRRSKCSGTPIRSLNHAAQVRPDESVGQFGSSLESHRSVVTAIASFTENIVSYANTIMTAITFGDDTDTVAAMAGAMSGALLGIEAVPQHLLSMLEDDVKGLSYLRELATALFELHARST